MSVQLTKGQTTRLICCLGAGGCLFEGVFARNLQIFQQASPEARYAKFQHDNATSIWATVSLKSESRSLTREQANDREQVG